MSKKLLTIIGAALLTVSVTSAAFAETPANEGKNYAGSLRDDRGWDCCGASYGDYRR